MDPSNREWRVASLVPLTSACAVRNAPDRRVLRGRNAMLSKSLQINVHRCNEQMCGLNVKKTVIIGIKMRFLALATSICDFMCLQLLIVYSLWAKH